MTRATQQREPWNANKTAALVFASAAIAFAGLIAGVAFSDAAAGTGGPDVVGLAALTPFPFLVADQLWNETHPLKSLGLLVNLAGGVAAVLVASDVGKVSAILVGTIVSAILTIWAKQIWRGRDGAQEFSGDGRLVLMVCAAMVLAFFIAIGVPGSSTVVAKH